MLSTFEYLAGFQKDVAAQMQTLKNQRVDPSLRRTVGASGPHLKNAAIDYVKAWNLDYQMHLGSWVPILKRSPYHRLNVLARRNQADADMTILENDFNNAISQKDYDAALAHLSDFITILVCMYKGISLADRKIYPLRMTGVADKLSTLSEEHNEFFQKLFTNPVGEQCLYDVYEGLCLHDDPTSLPNFRHMLAPFLSKENLKNLGYPLHRAARDNNHGTFMALVGLGADIRGVNGDGMTPFEMSFDAFVKGGSFHFHCFRACIGSELINCEASSKVAASAQNYNSASNEACSVFVSRKAIPGARPSQAPENSKYTVKIVSDGGTASREVLIYDDADNKVVQTVNKKHGIYRSVRQSIIQAISPILLTENQAAALLRAGEFETFIFLKWLGHIEFSEDPAKLYSMQSKKTGDSLLHYLARCWTDADFLFSNLQKIMYLDMMEHIIETCGEDARKICNLDGDKPADVCAGREIRTLTGARSIRMYPWTSFLIALSEVAANAITPASSRELTCLPTGFSTNPLALPERIIAMFKERRDHLTEVDKVMLNHIIDISNHHQDRVAQGDTDYQTGDYIIKLALEIKKLSLRERSLVTHQDKPGSFFYRNGSVMVDELLILLFEGQSIETVTPAVIRDQFLCHHAHDERFPGDEHDRQGQSQSSRFSVSSLPQYDFQGKEARGQDGADVDVNAEYQLPSPAN